MHHCTTIYEPLPPHGKRTHPHRQSRVRPRKQRQLADGQPLAAPSRTRLSRHHRPRLARWRCCSGPADRVACAPLRRRAGRVHGCPSRAPRAARVDRHGPVSRHPRGRYGARIAGTRDGARGPAAARTGRAAGRVARQGARDLSIGPAPASRASARTARRRDDRPPARGKGSADVHGRGPARACGRRAPAAHRRRARPGAGPARAPRRTRHKRTAGSAPCPTWRRGAGCGAAMRWSSRRAWKAVRTSSSKP